MITRETFEQAIRRASKVLEANGITITPAEREHFEVADFGLSDLDHTGLEIIVYINTGALLCQGTGDVSRADVVQSIITRRSTMFPAKKKRFAAGGAPSICTQRVSRRRRQPVASRRVQSLITRSGMRSASTPVNNTPCTPIPCIGSKRGRREPSYRSFQPGVETNWTGSRIPASSGKPPSFHRPKRVRLNPV